MRSFHEKRESIKALTSSWKGAAGAQGCWSMQGRKLQRCSITPWSICRRSTKSSAPAESCRIPSCCSQRQTKQGRDWEGRVPTVSNCRTRAVNIAPGWAASSSTEQPWLLGRGPRAWEFLTSEPRFSQNCLLDEDLLPEKRKSWSCRLFQAAKENSGCGRLMDLSSDDTGLTCEMLGWCWLPLQDVGGDIHRQGKTYP